MEANSPSKGSQPAEAAAQNHPAGHSPLSAGLHGQRSRSSLGSPRSSRDSLLDSEQQPYQQQQQQLQQPGPQLQQQQLSSSQRHQQDAEQLQQQQQQVHGMAYISVNGRGNEGSPRSPSRLRYVRKDSASVAAAAAAATAPQLPDFLQVQELPPGVLHEDEVEIVHQEGDEQQRQADVEDKIISQVDQLVEYFNSLFHDDQIDISTLEQALQTRDMELSRKNLLIQQLMSARQQQQLQLHVHQDDTLWGAIKRSWQRSRCCWLFVLFLLVALILVIALPAGLVKRPGPAAPSFLYTPYQLSSSNASMDMALAVDTAAVVHYVLLPRGVGTGWEKMTAADVQLASQGLGWSPWETKVHACGLLSIGTASMNSSFSVASINTPECLQQQGLVTGGHSCLRCPVIASETEYDVLLVAEASGASSAPVHTTAATLPGYASRAPMLKGGATVRASSTGIAESTFELTFQINEAGTVQFLVMYANMYARFMDTYVVFDNTVTEPNTLLDSAITDFQNGVVARGQITVDQPGVEHTCIIGGGSSTGTTCSCTPAATCNQEATCFGALCDYSRVSLAPSTVYKVVLVPVSLDGHDRGTAALLPAFSTGDPLTPPRLSEGLGINPVVGPDRFNVFNISQDKPGFAYVLVTRPQNQVNPQVPAGTATPFTHIPGASRSRGTRQLTATSGTSLLVLPPESGASSSGDAFLPPCKTPLPCDAYVGTAREYVASAADTVVFQRCVPIAKITEATSALVTSLSNNTLYKVTIIPTDLKNNQDAWSALIRTQDLTPPVLTITDTPPPDFDSFYVIGHLDEAGTVYATLILSSEAGTVSAAATCPPTFQGSVVGRNSYQVSAGRVVFNTSWAGLTANTDYLLKLIAVDTVGNCQPAFTDLPVHTLDNIPPTTLAFEVVQIGGTTAGLQITLDEPSTVYYAVMPRGTACPDPAVLFAAATATPPGSAAAGNASVPLGNVPAVVNVSGLTSETEYTACVIAADVTRLQNKQAGASSEDFRTLDVTPPVVSVTVVPGTDGNFTCDRTSFLCSISFQTQLNEPGSVAWALPLSSNASVGALPSPVQLLDASDASQLFLAGTTPAGSMQMPAASTVHNATVTGLASETRYMLAMSAKDAAPLANYISSLVLLNLTAPDVRPPVFTDVRLEGTADTTVTVNVTLDEDSTVYLVVVPHPSAKPTSLQVSSGQAANNAQPVAAGHMSASANTSLLMQANGLSPGSWYDIYLVAADDPAGNLQTTVTNITRIRTTDSVPPIITDLTATFTPPMSLTLTYTVSKAGSLLLAPRRTGQAAPTTAQEVLTAVATRSTADANFTATVTVAAAAVTASQVLCVADGDKLVVYAVARDTEGQWPGRQDNISPLESVVVTLQPASTDATCPSLAYLQPRLTFSTGAATPGLSVPGLLLGASTVNTSTAGTVLMQQGAVAMLDSSVLAADYHLAGHIGATSAASGAIRLPGTMPVSIQALPPAQISIIARSTQLVADANGNEGSTLHLSYQLKDSACRTHVSTNGLLIRPQLSYDAGATPPAGTLAADNALPDCDMSTFDAASGIGDCSVVLDRKLFPQTGVLQGTVTVNVFVGTTQAASAQVTGLQLLAAPAIPAFTPTSQPGLLVKMPYRSVCFGETIKVSLQALNPLMRGITGFTLPLRYDTTLLEFREARSSALWQQVTVAAPRADGGNFFVVSLSAGKRGTQPDTAYRADSTGILLVEAFFTVRATRTGAVPAALAFGGTGPSLWPSWTGPYYQFNNFNGASNSAGSITVSPVTTLGMWAWAENYDLFNTAALNGQQVSTSLRGMLVKSYGGSSSATGDTLSGCSIAASSPRAASVAIDALRRVCVVNVNAVNAVPAQRLGVTLSIPDSVSTEQTAQVTLDVWYPSNLTLTAADNTLNSILPINAAPSTPSCASYQSTALRLTATFSNGAAGPANTLTDTDVTNLVTFSSNDTNVAQVFGPMVKGVTPGLATISTSASSTLKLPLTVSSEPACLVQLHTAATTGAGAPTLVSPSGNSSSSGSSRSGVALRPGTPTSLAWQARQDLIWEDSSALVLSYARFSDGSVVDVMDKTAVTAVAPGAGALPFSLSTDNTTGLRWLTVNVEVGTTVPCQQNLQSSWSVCSNSVVLGTGQGSVAVKLPKPSAVASFTATPRSITSSEDAARLNPLLVATSSRLSLAVAFDDGVTRDFSTDRRVVYGVAQGSMCEVVKGTDGTWQVHAAAGGSSLAGTCSITATVTFQGGIAPLTATTAVDLVWLTQLAVYALSPDLDAVPALPPASALVQGDELVLLQCEANRYDQRSLWTYGVLSNCSASNVCPQVNVNSRQYTSLNSSAADVATFTTGGYPLLDNILAPTAAGSSNISSSFAGALSRRFSLSVKDTYQDTWPTAAPLSDTSARVDANMSNAAMLVTYLMVPSSQLDVRANPPVMPGLSKVQAGVSLVADPTRGPNFLTATSTGLIPGTNYTVLAAVRLSSGGSSSTTAASPTVVALTGLLVPDTAPPTFTKATVKAVTPGSGSNGSSSAGATTFSIQMDLGLNEDGRVYYAVYGDPACITADPTPAQIVSGVNLADVGKCNCSSRYCAAAAEGWVPISSGNGSAVVTLRANLPPFPFDNLGADATCSDYTPSGFASLKHAVYLVAEDRLPTYKGWTSVCSVAPPTSPSVATPCPTVSVSPCRNTAPATESINQQAPPFVQLNLYSDTAAASAPLGSPVKGLAQLVDPVLPDFVNPAVASSGTSVVWTFQTTKPGLVMWRLVEQVTQVIASGLVAVGDASLTYTVPVSRKCSGQQLVQGTAYALWFNMTDIYGKETDVSILKITL